MRAMRAPTMSWAKKIAAQPVGAQEVGKAGALQAAATGVAGVIRQPQQ